MIYYKTGNLLESEAEALVNTVNLVGIMGKGIALQFKNAFPKNYKIYADACKNKTLQIGQLLLVEDESILSGKKRIVNFPTKTDWRKPSEYSYIEQGLGALVKLMQDHQIASIAIPSLGAGNGKLDWPVVKSLIEKYLTDVDAEIFIYQPNTEIQDQLRKERVKLTPARAMLLSVLYDLVSSGEFVSEFSAEKIAYFLQRFGAKDAFNLEFKPNYYGPYSGKVKHVLHYLNGSYVLGYSAKDKKPFEELFLVADGEADVNSFLSKPENADYQNITTNAKAFLQGFYSPFGLELLATIDFIVQEKEGISFYEIIERLGNWSGRKQAMFTKPEFVKIALDNLKAHL